MKRFALLYAELDESNRTSEKLAALERYFREAPPEDAAWGLAFLSGRRTKRALSYNVLRKCALAASGLPEWLLEECVSAVGDFSETLALILPQGDSTLASKSRSAQAIGRGSLDGPLPAPSAQRSALSPSPAPSLHEIVERYILPLPACTEAQAEALLWEVWSRLATRERFVYHKLLSTNFRVGVQRRLVARALASVAGIDPAVMEHRLAGEYKPTPESYAAIIATESAIDDVTKPYPFCLASQLDSPPPPTVDASRWQIEWKWDGIRAQLIRRTDAQGARRTVVWSRGEELITDQFPELKRIAAELPCDVVLDGEVLAWDDDALSDAATSMPATSPRYRGKPLSFAVLQTRLNRKGVAPGLFDRTDLVFMAYDLLELEGRDVRSLPLAERRRELERIANSAPAELPLRLSQTLRADSWEHVGALRARATTQGAEGIMLKPLDSPYGVGRARGDLTGDPAHAGWWKWKIDPLSLDAVLIAAQPGSGKRAGLFTDLTFGLWHEGSLVPFAKAYSGLDDAEIARVDSFIRRNTVSKSGPVRIVKPHLVFEIAFEAIRESTRHKSGISVRFPRIARWRQDKPVEEADTLENARRLLSLTYGSMTPTAPSKNKRSSRTRNTPAQPPTDPAADQLFPGFNDDDSTRGAGA